MPARRRPKRFPFLSDAWIEAARRIRAEYHGRVPAFPVPVRMNQIVRGVPFGSGVVQAHLDTTDGEIDLDTGHLVRPDLTVTLDYATAKSILVEGDAQAALQAFFGGRIKVDGDITKVLSLQAGATSVDPSVAEVFQRIRDITE